MTSELVPRREFISLAPPDPDSPAAQQLDSFVASSSSPGNIRKIQVLSIPPTQHSTAVQGKNLFSSYSFELHRNGLHRAKMNVYA